MQKAFSRHIFRAHADDHVEVPTKAPEGAFFFLSTRPGINGETKKRYFVDAPRKNSNGLPIKVITSLSQNQGKRFNQLVLAESFADFLHDEEVFPEAPEFFITLETLGGSEHKIDVYRPQHLQVAVLADGAD